MLYDSNESALLRIRKDGLLFAQVASQKHKSKTKAIITSEDFGLFRGVGGAQGELSPHIGIVVKTPKTHLNCLKIFKY